MPACPNPLHDLVNDIAGFTHDPLGHALYAYPWGSPILPEKGPRAWQREQMQAIGEHLANPATRHQPYRAAVASGHGIGKSAGVAMLVHWALDTCEDTRVVVTANTETQIINKTWPEVTKWHNLSFTSDWFKPTATGLISTQPKHDRSWRADAVTWSANNTEAFAGLHNLGKRIVLIFDEASGIIDEVWNVAQGALTDTGTEIIWLVFGNPTKNSGRFRECFGKHRNLWNGTQIDSRDVEGTNKTYLRELVDTYGVDSDIVRVRVRGQFPAASSLQFIASDVVAAAQARIGTSLPTDPLIYGIDVARYGDDNSVLAKRKGRDAKSRPWKRWHGVDTMTLAGDIAAEARREHPDAVFVDVGAMGAGVVDRLRQLNVANVFEVNFGAKGRDALWTDDMRIKVANKSAEMWTNMRAWLRHGAIPEEPRLQEDLTNREYGYNAAQEIMLEQKDHMRKRGLASPDEGDALALTFAEHVAPKEAAVYIPGFMGDSHAGY